MNSDPDILQEVLDDDLEDIRVFSERIYVYLDAEE